MDTSLDGVRLCMEPLDVVPNRLGCLGAVVAYNGTENSFVLGT